jgi:hypothetical protein
MKPASISTFIHFLPKIRELLSAAYPVQVVAKGWIKSGIYPYNHEIILAKHPQYDIIKNCPEDYDRVMDSIEILSHMARAEGYIKEQDMRALLGEMLLPDLEYAKDYEILPFNWVRTLWLNHEHTLLRRRERIMEEEQNNLITASKGKSSQATQQEKNLNEKAKKRKNQAEDTGHDNNQNSPQMNPQPESLKKKKRKSSKSCVNPNCFNKISNRI